MVSSFLHAILMKGAVFLYIEYDYNRTRRQTTIGDAGPVNYDMAIAA